MAEHAHSQQAELYGVVARFASAEAVIAAAEKVRDAGYTKTDAYTPFPVEGLDEALGMQQTRLGWVVLIMGIVGACVGFGMQWWANVEFYPLNIGGKPLNSWPNFIVITFECTILFSAFTAGLFMLGRNGLPQYYHSIFNTPSFEDATRDKFFLCIEARDKAFDSEKTSVFLESLGPEMVVEVEK